MWAGRQSNQVAARRDAGEYFVVCGVEGTPVHPCVQKCYWWLQGSAASQKVSICIIIGLMVTGNLWQRKSWGSTAEWKQELKEVTGSARRSTHIRSFYFATLNGVFQLCFWKVFRKSPKNETRRMEAHIHVPELAWGCGLSRIPHRSPRASARLEGPWSNGLFLAALFAMWKWMWRMHHLV